MKTRKLTIEPLYGYSATHPHIPASSLRLRGLWLRQFGFEPGDHVEVAAEGDHLVIRKALSLREEPTPQNHPPQER